MAPRLRTRSQSPPTTTTAQQQQQQTHVSVDTRPLLAAAAAADDSQPSLRSSSFSDASSVGSSQQPQTAAEKQQQQQQPTLDAVAVARMQHDHFNLVVLIPVVVTTLINWDWHRMMQGHNPVHCWTGTYYYTNWVTTFLYFLSDLIWVAVVPICVKSPDVIIKHHFIALLYLLGPMKWAEYRWAMGACLLVEINTWFLILRRVLFKNTEASTSVWAAAAQRIVSFCFYTSWIVIRCIVYPAILYEYLNLAFTHFDQGGSFEGPLLVIPLHAALCILNLKWTFDLFRPMVQGWFARGDQRQQRQLRTSISSGL